MPTKIAYDGHWVGGHQFRMNQTRFKEPTLLSAMGSFARSMGRATLVGFKHVDDKEFGLRVSTCDKCPDRNTRFNQCERCLCFLKFKIPLATENCPEWDAARGPSQ